MNIKIKKLVPEAVIPFKKHKSDACYDLTAISMNKVSEPDYGYLEYGFGLAMELPKGYCALIFPRSSCSDTGLILSNAVGVIDEDYRGEWKARFKYIPGSHYYNIGDRIAQFMVIPTTQLTFKEVEELAETPRGEGGYGSTNK